MMLGGVGFRVGLDEVRRKQIEAQRQAPARDVVEAHEPEDAPRQRRSVAGGVPDGEAQAAGRLNDVALGPVQLLVVGFDRPNLSGEVLAELERLRQSDVVRVIDLLVVHKNAEDVVERLHRSDLTAGEGAGAVVGALTGLDAAGNEDADGGQLEDEFWSLDEAIRNDSAATIALVEHRWAIGTRDAIPAARGVPVVDAWIHPADLVVAGLLDAEDAAK